VYPLLVHVMGMTAVSNETNGRFFKRDWWNVRTYTHVADEECAFENKFAITVHSNFIFMYRAKLY
jgi:hypothetical protein